MYCTTEKLENFAEGFFLLHTCDVICISNSPDTIFWSLSRPFRPPNCGSSLPYKRWFMKYILRARRPWWNSCYPKRGETYHTRAYFSPKCITHISSCTFCSSRGFVLERISKCFCGTGSILQSHLQKSQRLVSRYVQTTHGKSVWRRKYKGC